MTGETTSPAVTGSAAAPEVTDGPRPVLLGEFCSSLSVHDKRVELISGFHSDEKREGRLFDTEAAYQQRFEAFAVRPVK